MPIKHQKKLYYQLNSSHDGICIIGDIYRTTELQIWAEYVTVEETDGMLHFPSVADIEGKSYPVTEIEDFAFKHLSANQRSEITHLLLPDTLKSIGKEVFSGFTMLTSVVLPKSLSKIGSGAFKNCENLKSIIIPNSVKELEEKTFYDCRSLKNIFISDSVVSIGSLAFAYCPSISSVHIGQGVTSLDSSAFSSSNIEQIEVDPRNVKFDSRNGCNAIIETDTNTLILASKSTVIPDSVAIIGKSVFSNHYDLQVIAIPKSVIEIKEDAFEGCVNIEEVQYGGTLEQWKKIIFRNQYSNPLYYTKKLMVGDELHYVHDEEDKFVDIRLFMKEVSILEDPRLSLLNFDLYEHSTWNKMNFYINLAYLIDFHKKKSSTWAEEIQRFLDSIFEIEDDVNRFLYIDVYFSTLLLSEADSLYSELPNTNIFNKQLCTSHIEQSFLRYKLKDNGLIKFDSIFFNSNFLSAWYWSWFDKSKLEKEIQNVNKRDFINAIRYGRGEDPLEEEPRKSKATVTDDHTEYYSGLYFKDKSHSVVTGCADLNTTTVNIPKSVKRIGKFAFHQCRKLTSVNIPDSVEVIDWFAFAECDSLVSVTIPDSVMEVGKYAFHYCRNLDTIKMSKKAYGQCGASIPDEVPYPGDILKAKKKKVTIVIQ